MRIKLILFVLLLAVILFLINLVSGRYLSSLVDQQLKEAAITDSQREYHYQDLKINPFLGSVTIRELFYRDKQLFFEAEEASGSLTWADLWRVFVHGSVNPLSQIHSFRVTLKSLNVNSINQVANNTENLNSANPTAQNSDPSPVTIQSLSLLYNGRMDELLNLSSNIHPPLYNHRINISMYQISAINSAYDFSEAFPVLSGYYIPDNIDQISFQIRYLSEHKTAQLSTLRILAPELTFRAGGDIQYDEDGWPGRPEKYSIYYQLDAATHEIARVNLPGMMGGFSMDTLSITSQLNFNRIMADRHPLSLPGETSLYMGDIYWYPSKEIIDRFGIIFGTFGLSEQELPVRSLRASYSISSDTLQIDDAVIYTDPFDARIQLMLTNSENRLPDIQNGSVTFVRTRTTFNDFVDGLEYLFNIEFPRKDGRIYFEFSGNPESPKLDIDL